MYIYLIHQSRCDLDIYIYIYVPKKYIYIFEILISFIISKSLITLAYLSSEIVI